MGNGRINPSEKILEGSKFPTYKSYGKVTLNEFFQMQCVALLNTNQLTSANVASANKHGKTFQFAHCIWFRLSHGPLSPGG